MRVVLTSFRDSVNWPQGYQFSIARSEPRNMGRLWPRIGQLSARDVDGHPLRHLTPEEFRPKYEERLAKVGGEALSYYLDAPIDTLVLLCWCNPARQRGYQRLYCHRILVGYWIEGHYPTVEVIYADGAENPIWERTHP